MHRGPGPVPPTPDGGEGLGHSSVPPQGRSACAYNRYTCIGMHMLSYVSTYMRVYIHMSVYTCTCMPWHMYVYAFMCMQSCIWMHVHNL